MNQVNLILGVNVTMCHIILRRYNSAYDVRTHIREQALPSGDFIQNESPLCEFNEFILSRGKSTLISKTCPTKISKSVQHRRDKLQKEHFSTMKMSKSEKRLVTFCGSKKSMLQWTFESVQKFTPSSIHLSALMLRAIASDAI